MTEYKFPYERIRQIKEQLSGGADEEPKTEEIKENSQDASSEDKLMKSLQGRTISLDHVEEGAQGRSNQESGDR